MKVLQFSILLVTILFLGSCAKPIAQFMVIDGDNVAPVKVKFENKSTDAEEYTWVFGDGDTSVAEAPFHTFKSSGKYEVQLIAKKGKKSSIYSKTIEVKEPEKCLVEIETSYGTMTILLYDATPKHRDNFLKLTEEGFYNDLLFHRVINGFMIQGGDPKSKNAAPKVALGTGGPGYTIDAEFVDTLVHVKGALAAARQSDGVNPARASSGSQFYIVQGRPVSKEQLNQMETRTGKKYTAEQRKKYMEVGGTIFLDTQYTVFGQVIKGLDVIDKIGAAQTMRGDRPLDDIKMTIRVVK
jgi:cyclophilin family peptidyl-prolyl cis-trans isomerase